MLLMENMHIRSNMELLKKLRRSSRNTQVKDTFPSRIFYMIINCEIKSISLVSLPQTPKWSGRLLQNKCQDQKIEINPKEESLLTV